MIRTAHHDTFVIERIYRAAPARVFGAFADPVKKSRWFACEDSWVTTLHELDFRVGGRERLRTGPRGGTVHAFDALYQDIVPDERIVFSYDMHLDTRKISVSLTTVEFKPDDGGTRMVFTEQGVFLDGYEDKGERREGTLVGLEKLGVWLSAF
jgi:uncharacterized protein YndB with AHSA1/START domain